MNYTVEELSRITGGKITGSRTNVRLQRLTVDSRTIAFAENTLFVALRGPRHDGHHYISHALQQGVRVVLAEKSAMPNENPEASSGKKTGPEKNTTGADVQIGTANHNNPVPTVAQEVVTYILVHNTLEALQKLATYHRNQFDIPVLAITGSNGKTIVKEWLYRLLSSVKNVYRSPGSYNSQVGVPLSLCGINEEHELAIIEAGISQPGEMDTLEAMIRPTAGIFTRLGPAHQAGFSSLEEKALEKLRLFRGVKQLFYCSDQENIRNLIQNKLSEGFFTFNPEVITWGKHPGNTLQLLEHLPDNGNTRLHFSFLKQKHCWIIPFRDTASVENAMHAGTVSLHFGLPVQVAEMILKNLRPVEMRLEFKKGVHHSLLINDGYNLDPESLDNALEQLAAQKEYERTILIVSDLLETGMAGDKLYKKVAESIRRYKPSMTIGIGSEIKKFQHLFPANSRFYSTTHHFLHDFREKDFARSAVLLKGARAFKFEEIDRLLQQKQHRTVLEVNLDAVVENLNFYRRQLKKGVRLMGMVKAFSYGSGSVEIARLLQNQRVDYLGVAYADEGRELRENGITLPIMVMNPETGSFPAIIQHGLEPEIYSFSQLESFYETLDTFQGVSGKIGIHIKADTGMHRLGFAPGDAAKLAKKLVKMPLLEVRSVFSHLAASDDLQQHSFTAKQVKLLEDFCQTLENHGISGFLRHICNTAGILNHPEAHFDMVRLGLGMYGADITGNHQNNLQPALVFKTVISQIHDLKPGDTVGYDRAGRITRPSRIATLMAGYADGIKTSLSNGIGYVCIKNQKAPFAGKVCMDMCMVDITEIPGVKEGDEAIIFGEAPTVTEVARMAGTIPYDVLTGIPPRVKRIYYRM